MKRSLIITLGCALALSLGAYAQGTGAAASDGAGAASPAASATEKSAKPSGYPFRGKLKSVDAAAKTFTLAGKEKDRVFHVTAGTKFTKEGKAATLAAGNPDDEVAGYARTASDGKTEVISVRFGPAPEGAKEKKSARKPAATAETTMNE